MNCISNRGIAIVMGDMNAKSVSQFGTQLRRAIGQFGICYRNGRGGRHLQFAAENKLGLMNTIFKHHIRRLCMWKASGDRYRNQTDYILTQDR